MQLYVDRFNRRDWDGVRELTRADARLNVAERFAGKFAHAPYFFNYERWGWPWKLALGELDGEAVVIVLPDVETCNVEYEGEFCHRHPCEGLLQRHYKGWSDADEKLDDFRWNTRRIRCESKIGDAQANRLRSRTSTGFPKDHRDKKRRGRCTPQRASHCRIK
jgi:hypothetical protein